MVWLWSGYDLVKPGMIWVWSGYVLVMIWYDLGMVCLWSGGARYGLVMVWLWSTYGLGYGLGMVCQHFTGFPTKPGAATQVPGKERRHRFQERSASRKGAPGNCLARH